MRTRPRLLRVCGAVLLLALAQGCGEPEDPGATESSARPNIVLIMTDDQGVGDLSVHGNPVLETPHIDTLAEQSCSLMHFYVSPVCTPTRASLMTGRYSYRTRAIDTYVGRAMMEPAERTIAEALRDAGYRTGIFGKWHLGDCYPMRPQDQGFDEVLIHRGGGLAQPADPPENRRRYTDAVLFHNGEQVQTSGYCTDVFTEAAIQFMRQCRTEGRPFFAYLATNAPHGPLHDVPEKLYEKYRSKDLSSVVEGGARNEDKTARVFAMIENIDANVGRVLAELERLGIEENTLVVYLHDNGPSGRRFNVGLRGTKSHVYEGGIRSPLFLRWPRRLEPGVVARGFGAHIDLHPTLLAAAGLSVGGESPRLDGIDLLPLLQDPTRPWPDRSLVLQSHRGDAPSARHHFAVRRGPCKLVRPSGFGRKQAAPDVALELYDLDEDPGEQRDLATQRPELVHQLLEEYDRWFADVSSTREDNYAPPRIAVGRDGEAVTVLTRQDWRVADQPGWGKRGTWLLDVRGLHDYAVEILLPDSLQAPVATLVVGEEVLELPGSAGSQTLRKAKLRLPEGSLSLSLSLADGEREVAPRQLILQRLD